MPPVFTVNSGLRHSLIPENATGLKEKSKTSRDRYFIIRVIQGKYVRENLKIMVKKHIFYFKYRFSTMILK